MKTIFTILLIICVISCKKKGCTYAGAINYDSQAEKDNGTCLFPEDVTVLFIQNKLVGTWQGIGVASFGDNVCEALFIIESNGHYSAGITSVQSGSISSVFDNGNDNLDNPEKKFTIQSIDSFGKSNGKVTFVHADGSLLAYQIDDLIFTNENDEVSFTVNWGAQINYSLSRM